MKQDALQQTSKYAKAHQRKRRWYKAVSCLAVVVVFCTTYALILPGITMERDAKCGIPEHVHDESCYIVVSEPHVHDESCYELVGGHAHTDDCYTLQRGELICGQEEREGHHHTDACYTETTTLVCGLEEDENHQHTAACYETTRELTCGLEESDGHQHTDECYAWEQVLTCGQEESEGQLVLTCNLEEGEVTTTISDTPVCGLEEHTHTLACYSDPAADVETAQIWERAIKNVELTGDWREDVIAIAKTQLGYQESAKNYIVLEDGETIKGYTRYGAWYGDPYGDWCAMFASFVLNYAEVEGIPLDANCQHWIETLSKEENDLYRPADEYLPQPGDLVFFDFDIEDEEEKDEAPTADHVGLVVEIMNDEDENPIKLKTIEGDSSDKVQYVTYELDDPAILGYGQLPEQEPEDEEPAEQFVLTAESEDGIAVTVTGDPESLPYPVEEITLSVQPVTDEDVIALWKQTVEEAGENAEEAFLLDIALLHDREEIEPAGPVRVTFEGVETGDNDELTVFHVDAENEETEDMNAVVDEAGTVVLDTDHFSVYGGLVSVSGHKEHTHTLACYSDPAADVETAQIWECAIKNVELTGDWREDVIAIAKTQLGYQESAKNYIVLEDGETIKGYTRYGAWYGDPYGDWCAMFASFVLNYAEVEGIPLDANCQHWIETLSKEENDLYRPADEYLPQPGDLVFFDFDIEDEEEKDEAPTADHDFDIEDEEEKDEAPTADHDFDIEDEEEKDEAPTADHVGLVVEIMNDEDENPIKLKTIEGDSSDKVQYVTYELDDPAILGYGQLPEQEPAEQFVLTAESEDGIAVTVTGDPESLPYPVEEITLSVQPVTDEDVIALWKQTVEEEDLDADAGFLLELALIHDGEEIEPIGPVQVAFSGLEDQEECPAVFHLDAENESAEDMNAVLDEEGAVVLDTEHFSPYAGAPRRLSAPTGTAISGNLNDTSSLSAGSYYLSADAYTNNTISISGNVTLDLNGKGFYYTGTDQLFEVKNGGSLTIIDSSSEEPTSSVASGDKYGHRATVGWDGNKPQTLEYYVTETSASGITTSESLVKYTATAKGFIVAENSGGAASVVKVKSGGTFNLEGGMLTMKNSASYSGDAHIIMNAGTVNLDGGYVCGGQDTGWGGGIYSSGTINMTGGVVAANAGQSGGGICVNGGTMNMSGGVISGNWTNNSSSNIDLENQAYDGGGVYVSYGGTLNLSGGYITNNFKSLTDANDSYDRHGGGGVAIDHGSTMNMTGGYVTGNRSEDAAGGIFAGYRENSNFSMTGGIIASNFANHGEGGGLRVGGGTNAIIDASSGGKIYITNNKTNDNKDWGGGGIFIQQNGNLNILDVLVTNNNAGGFGGGVAGCPTADVSSSGSGINDRGAAIFGNQASVEEGHLRRQFNYKDYDRTFWYNFVQAQNLDRTKTAQDYFGTGNTNNISPDMLGGGNAEWKDPLGNSTTEWNMGENIKVAPLTSYATQEDREKAIEAARVFIAGNYSYTNGGGIMSNGVLDMGMHDTTTFPATLILEATKRLEDTDGNPQALTDKQFSFVLLNREPQWDETNGQFIYDDSMDIMGAENDTDGNIQFRDMTFIVAGTYTYYLIEQPVNDTSITQDPVLYKIVVTVTATETTENDVRKTTCEISNVEVSKGGTVIQTDSSSATTKTVTILKSGDTATFVNHVVPCYSLPATGGAGTTPYTTGGLLLMVSASALLLYNHQKRRKEATASS